MRVFKNDHGSFKSGTKVHFTMENEDMWGGDTEGILFYKEDDKKWVIQTERSGEIGIGGYLEAYGNTIYEVEKTILEKMELNHKKFYDQRKNN